jgi:hypothetical protein
MNNGQTIAKGRYCRNAVYFVASITEEVLAIK